VNILSEHSDSHRPGCIPHPSLESQSHPPVTRLPPSGDSGPQWTWLTTPGFTAKCKALFKRDREVTHNCTATKSVELRAGKTIRKESPRMSQPLPKAEPLPDTRAPSVAPPLASPATKGWSAYDVWRERVFAPQRTGYKSGRGNP
jgi:hypothetical protein